MQYWFDATSVVSQDKNICLPPLYTLPLQMFFNSWTMGSNRQDNALTFEYSIICVTIHPINYLSRCTSLRAIIPFDIAKVGRNNSCAFFRYVCRLCLSPRPVGCVQKWMSCAYSVNKQWDDTGGCLECKHLLLLLWLVVSVQRIASDHRAGQGACLSNAICPHRHVP